MKKITKLLSFAMAIILVVGVLLSAPFTVNAVAFNTYWADSEYFRLQDGSDNTESSVQKTTSPAYYRGVEDATHKMVQCKSGNEEPGADYGSGQINKPNILTFPSKSGTVDTSGTEYTKSLSSLPYATMYYYAPKTMEYTIRVGIYTNEKSDTRLPIFVNDKKYYVADLADSTSKVYLKNTDSNGNPAVFWEAEYTITLDKGVGFIRIILREDDRRSTHWCDLHYVDLDDNLTALVRDVTSLSAGESKYYNAYYNGSSFQNTNNVELITTLSDGTKHWCGSYSEFWSKDVYRAAVVQCVRPAQDHTHQYNSVDKLFTPNYGYIDSAGNLGYISNNGTGSYVQNTDDDHTNKISFIPFISYTVDVAVAGYYDITFRSDHKASSSWQGHIMLAVNDWIYHKNVANYTESNVAPINLSVYMPAGRVMLTFSAPFSVKKPDENAGQENSALGYFNMYGVEISGGVQPKGNGTTELVKYAGANNQVNPQNVRSMDLLGAEVRQYNNGTAYGEDSGPIYADTSAVFNGILNDDWKQEDGKYTFGNQHYRISAGETLDASKQVHKDALGTLPSDFSTHKLVGGLGNISHYQPVIQSWRSILEDQYINKSYTPMVSYQVLVPEGCAGTYQLTTNYQVALNAGYSYDDYYAVISVNDNQFMQAPFTDMCNGENTPCDKHAHIGGADSDKVKGEYLRFDTDAESSHWTINRHYVKLVEGVNTIRVIAAVYETAAMVEWVNQTYIRLQGPGQVTGIAVPNEGRENDPAQYVASHRYSWYDPNLGNNDYSDNTNMNNSGYNFVSRNSKGIDTTIMEGINALAKSSYDYYHGDAQGNGNHWSEFSNLPTEQRNAPLTYNGVSVAVNVWGFNPIKCSEAEQMAGESGYNNPRQSYFVGNAYYEFNEIEYKDPQKGDSSTGETKYVKGGSYENLYDTLKLSDLEKTPCVRYKFNNTGKAGYYDIDLTFKADMNNADILTEGGIPYYTVVVLHAGTAPRKYKCKMFYRDRLYDINGELYDDENNARGAGQMYDNTANLSVYLPEGESDIFIINPLDRSFDLRYGTEGQFGKYNEETGEFCLTKNGVPSEHNWCDQGSIRIGAGNVEVYHPSDSWKDASTANVLAYYNAVKGGNQSIDNLTNDPNADFYQTCVDGQELLKVTIDNYVENQTDKEKFLERREWAMQYLTYIIQDYEGQTLNNQGASVQLMEEKIDLEEKLATLDALTYEEACAWVDTTNRKLGDGWEGYIHYLTEVNSVDVEELVADSDDAVRISDAQAYLNTSKQNATNNSTVGNSTDLTIGDENKADSELASDSKLTVRDSVATHLNSIRDAFYSDVSYTNGWASIIELEWEVDESYRAYMEYAEEVITGTDSFYDLRKEYHDKTTYDQVIPEIKARFNAQTGLDFDTYFANNLDSKENVENVPGRDSVNAARIPFAVRDVIVQCQKKISEMTYNFINANATTLDQKETSENYALNRQRIIDCYEAMMTEVMGRINALKFQMGVWTQYQTKESVTVDAKFGYVRLFFEIDPGANEYVNAETVTLNGGMDNDDVRKDDGKANELEYTGPLFRELEKELTGKYGFAIYMPWWDNGNPRYTEVVDLSQAAGGQEDCTVGSITWNKPNSTTPDTMLPDTYAGDGNKDGYADWGVDNGSGVTANYNAYYSSSTGKRFVYMYIEIPKRYWGEDFYVFGYCADRDGVYVSKREIVNLQYYWDTGKKKTDIYVTN